jgi:hypothetical protein
MALLALSARSRFFGYQRQGVDHLGDIMTRAKTPGDFTHTQQALEGVVLITHRNESRH